LKGKKEKGKGKTMQTNSPWLDFESIFCKKKKGRGNPDCEELANLSEPSRRGGKRGEGALVLLQLNFLTNLVLHC